MFKYDAFMKNKFQYEILYVQCIWDIKFLSYSTIFWAVFKRTLHFSWFSMCNCLNTEWDSNKKYALFFMLFIKIVSTVDFSSENSIRVRRFGTSSCNMANTIKCNREIMKCSYELEHMLINSRKGIFGMLNIINIAIEPSKGVPIK